MRVGVLPRASAGEGEHGGWIAHDGDDGNAARQTGPLIPCDAHRDRVVLDVRVRPHALVAVLLRRRAEIAQLRCGEADARVNAQSYFHAAYCRGMESSPLWVIALLAIIVGPFIWALVYGIRHRDSGAPEGSKSMETDANIQELRNARDMRTRGR